MSSLSYVRSVSVFILLFRILLNQLVVIFVLRTWAIWERSRPILLFLIGLTIVTVAVPHTNYILLTGVVEGFCGIIDRCDQASASNGPWHVISLHPCDKRDLTYHWLLVTTPSINVLGAGQYKIPTSSVQYAWVASTPFLLILVLQSCVSSYLVVILSSQIADTAQLCWP